MSQHNTRTPRSEKETELLQVLQDTKRELKEERQRQREKAISELGALAYKAGLHLVDRAMVQVQFLKLAQDSMVPLAVGDGLASENVSITSTPKAVTQTTQAYEKEYNEQNQ